MMIDMLQTPEEANECASIGKQGPDYHYGLRFSLNQASIDKLGLKIPVVGTEYKIQAEGLVVSCGMDDPADEKAMNIQIQITELELVPESAQEEATEQPETLMS